MTRPTLAELEDEYVAVTERIYRIDCGLEDASDYATLREQENELSYQMMRMRYGGFAIDDFKADVIKLAELPAQYLQKLLDGAVNWLRKFNSK